MKTRYASAWLGGACLLALMAASPAMAQDAAPAAAEDGTALDEVVVTARRTEERLQEVPVTVTAISGAEVAKQDVRTIFELDRKIPGLQIVGRGTGLNNAFLRGIPGVVAYWAETPVQLSGSALFFDLGSVQALKGPQGTLFGLSANAGALVYGPVNPGSGGSYLQATIGSYSRRTIEGAVNIPIGDRVDLRLGVQSNTREGITYDLSQGKDVNDEDWLTVRVGADVRLTDALENRFVFNTWENKTNGNEEYVLHAVNPTGLARSIFGPALDAYLAQQQQLGRYTIVGSGQKTWSKQFQTNISNVTEWQVAENLTLKNIFGYQSFMSYGTGDLDATPLPILDQFVRGEHSGPVKQRSEEIQAQGSALDDKLDYTAGVFFMETDTSNPRAGYGITLGGQSATISDSVGKTKAVYGQVNYDASEWLAGLELTGGYRYTWDSRKSAQLRLNAQGVVVQTTEVEADFKAPSYTIQARWTVNDNFNVYFNNSKGYSSGGFNLTAPPQFRTYEPESLTNYEIGFKSEWDFGEAALRVNAAAYYGKYNDIQVQVTQPVQTPTGTVLSVVTQNAAKGTIKGLEAEVDFLPIRDLRFSFAGTLMRGKYNEWMSNGQDLSDTPFLYMPKKKFTTSVVYTLPLSGDLGSVDFGADYSWQSSIKTNIGAELLHPYSTTPSFGTLNARIEWNAIAGRPVDLSFFVNNINKNEWSQGQLGAYNSLGLWSYAAAMPRMWGLRLRYTFE